MANHPRVSEHPDEIGTRIFWYFFSSINFFRLGLYIFRYFLPVTLLLLPFRVESEARLVSSCALAVVVVVLVRNLDILVRICRTMMSNARDTPNFGAESITNRLQELG